MTMGTASALPTANRYPSAHILTVRERLFLIDCGEGAQMQMRKFGVSFGKRYTKLTHLHLSPLTAVYKEQALTNRKDVSAWVSICSGEGRSRPHCKK